MQTTETRATTPENHPEDLFVILTDAPDNYILRQTFEPETEQETQQQGPSPRNPN